MESSNNFDPRLAQSLSDGTRLSEANQVLDELGPAGLDRLLEVIAAEQKSRKTRLRQTLFCLILFFVVFLVITVVVSSITGRFINMFGGFSGMFAIVGALAAISSTQRNAMLALTRYDDVRAIGPFVDGLKFQDKAMRTTIEGELVKLLPKVRAGDISLLDNNQRAALNQLLNQRRISLELKMAVLAAWNQIGDEFSLPFVNELAQNTASQELRAAAKQSIEYIKQNIVHINAARTLLRASTVNDVAPDALLRASGATQVTNSAQLLRADEGGHWESPATAATSGRDDDTQMVTQGTN